MEILSKVTNSPEETESVGGELARYVLANAESFVALYGDLGAGKTAFCRGFVGVISPDAHVCSPTYAIVNEYDGGDVPVFHFDMYRVESEDSLDSIGFYDYFGRGIIITEWSENIPYALPDRHIKVKIEKLSEDKRKITAELITE